MYLTDVTIREAGQLPGREYTVEQKLEAATRLDELGVTHIQATFPATGPVDRTVTERLSGTIDAEVVALARARDPDIRACLDAGADIVEVFGTVSDLHLEHVVNRSRAVMLESIESAVEQVIEAGAVPHVTLTDAFRTDVEHLVTAADRLDDAAVITLADTVGAKLPRAVERFLESITDHIDPERLGVHFHDDLGVATANVHVAAEFDVQRIDVSVGSLGERAGNPALEEVVVSSVLEDQNAFGMAVDDLIPACRGVLESLGESVHQQKAILGGAVLEHEAGIHTRAMLEEPSTFEPFDPALFGGRRRLLFGAQTGTSGARWLLERADSPTDEATVGRLRDALAGRGPVELETALDIAAEVGEDG
ncbi:MAG: LeuA family protein [Natronomonas sp.]|uniref:LeuA family protein n=1 Tax=Natronomonas sp. TaxID=2184060 RepID=UPI002870681A|nr:LeuA family protein [Natronomonas sp.]MDR9380787.1 LeuA family protein [Natronomonas sp.]MDR9431669.1 LeuA family protein [Natronomonas sp.]